MQAQYGLIHTSLMPYLGIEYAKQAYGVEIVRLGPDDFDTQAEADAIEQSIPKNPSRYSHKFVGYNTRSLGKKSC